VPPILEVVGEKSGEFELGRAKREEKWS